MENNHIDCDCQACQMVKGFDEDYSERRHNVFANIILVLFVFIVVFLFVVGFASADEININKLADAIYIAEGGINTKHPYGILAKYKTTTPRQACINTIKSNLKRWDGNGDFIVFISKTYCPIGAKNDPAGLNKNWVKNVKYYYGR